MNQTGCLQESERERGSLSSLYWEHWKSFQQMANDITEYLLPRDVTGGVFISCCASRALRAVGLSAVVHVDVGCIKQRTEPPRGLKSASPEKEKREDAARRDSWVGARAILAPKLHGRAEHRFRSKYRRAAGALCARDCFIIIYICVESNFKDPEYRAVTPPRRALDFAQQPPRRQMLEWLAALCFVILVVFIWTGSRYFGTTESRSSDVQLLQGPGIAQQPATEEKSGRRVSEERAGGGSGVSKKARAVALICKPSALANYLLKHCGTFSRYSPRVGWTWRASAVLQSAYEACWPYDSPVQFVRDNLQLSDDGLVSLDWAVPAYQRRRRTSSHSASPVLLIIPNSFGKFTRNVLKVREFSGLFTPR